MGLLNLFNKPLIALLNSERPLKGVQLSDYERIKYELKPCDVILVEGRSRVSNVIRLVTQSPWTHAALYIGRLHDIEDSDLRKIVSHHYQGDPGDRLIIESQLGDDTLVRNLDYYEKEHLRICRPARLGMRDAQQVVRYAISRLGVDYDVRHIFDLARLLFPWSILPRRWRSTLFKHKPGPSTRTVCSTMIAEAFAFVQFPILPLVKKTEDDKVQMFRRNPKLCTPSDFDYSPYFKIIKYPFVDIHYHDDHHLLPWHDGSEAQLDEEETHFYMEAETQPRKQDVEQAISQAIANQDSQDIAANQDSQDGNQDSQEKSEETENLDNQHMNKSDHNHEELIGEEAKADKSINKDVQDKISALKSTQTQ